MSERMLRVGSYKLGLQSLCHTLSSGLTMVEIGSFAGESAQIFAESGKFNNIYCVDTWQNESKTEKRFDAISQIYHPIIKKYKGRSNSVVNKFSDGFFDFVYIDADHSYESTLSDITNWRKKIKQNGIIAGHDFHLDGVKKAVMEVFGKPHNVFKDNSWIVFLKKFNA